MSHEKHDSHSIKINVAVAREKHFGHAAEACFAAQATLSVAIKKLEDKLGVTIFERGGTGVSTTPLGAQIVAQAERVLEQTAVIKEIAKQNKDPLNSPLRLGIVYTIGPHLLPRLVKTMIAKGPQMPLILQENFTVALMKLFRRGELDVAIMALLSPDQGIIVIPHAIAKARKDEMGNIVVELKNHPEHLKVRLMAGVLKACKSHHYGGLLHCCFNSAQDSLPLTSDLIPL